jgi:hypothetical protein
MTRPAAMTRLALATGTAIALAISSSASAQQGGSARGGSGIGSATTPPAATPAQAGRSDRYNTLRYVNGGDYGGAQLIVGTRGMSADQAAPSLERFNEDRGYNWDYEDERSASRAPITNNYVPANGQRVVSTLETTQNAAFQQRLEAANMQLMALGEIVTNGQYLSAAERAQAGELSRRLIDETNALHSVLDASANNGGRAFQTEREAVDYIAPRSTLLNTIQLNQSSGDGTLETTSESIVRLANSVAINSGNNAALVASTEILVRRADAIDIRVNIAAATTGPGAYTSSFGGLDLAPRTSSPTAASRSAAGGAGAGALGTAGTAAGRTAAGTAAGNIAAGAAAVANGDSGSSASHSGSSAGTGPAAQTEEADNRPPAPVPTSPDYPTHVRTQAERDAYDRRRQAEQMAAEAARQDALRREQEAESARQAELARREAARLADERARLARAAEDRANRDADWNAMVAGRFDSNRMWEEFRRNGGTLTTLELDDIYRNYDPGNSIPPAQSLSSAPRSLSAAGRSLSLAGTPVRSGTDDYEDPAVQSLYEALYGLTGRRRGPLGPSEEEVETANFGDYDLYSDPTGRWGQESGGYLAANLFDQEVDYLTRSIVNGGGGLSALLAQPFNVILTWGAGAYDLDLHMTGPTGLGATDRFHIYYSATGSLTAFPFAALIKDCICSAGSEVILTTTLLGGGVYRVSVFNFGDQAANSNNLSNLSNATIQIVRGGVATAQGNGTTITGGRTILTVNVPNGQLGNTWIAAELDPRSGRITVPRTIYQSQDSAHVR